MCLRNHTDADLRLYMYINICYVDRLRIPYVLHIIIVCDCIVRSVLIIVLYNVLGYLS